jgi:uncharacterized protein (DUF58 family)
VSATDRSRRRGPWRIDLARLNHILIPATKEERDRAMWRRGLGGKLFGVLFNSYLAGTEEGRFVFVLWLLVGALGLEVRLTQIHLVWCGLTGLLAASWLMRWIWKVELGLRLESPERVAVGEPCAIDVVLENKGPNDALALRVQRPLLPFDGRWTDPAPVVRRLGPGERTRTTTTARFSARGVHHLDPFHVGRIVPLGLAVGPSLESGGTRFVVVPRIAPVARLQVPSSRRYQPGGVALASQIGESRELIGLRPYRSGDRVRDLSARAWARTGQPVVREYQEEYFTRVGVVLDSGLSDGDPRSFEAAVSLAAGIVAFFTRGEALIDLLVVGERLHRMTLGRSLGFLDQALDLLAAVEPTDRFDAGKVEELLRPHLSRLSAVVVVALVEDLERRALVDHIAGHGTGCRAFVVGSDAGTFTPVPVSRIEGGGELAL